MNLSCLARTTHAFVCSQEIGLNPVQVLRDFGRFQLRDGSCAALLERLSTLCFLLILPREGASFNEELTAIGFPVSPSISAIVLFCELCVKREAEIDKVVWISPLCKKATRFARCSTCNVGSFEQCDFVPGRVVRGMSRQEVRGAASNDAATCRELSSVSSKDKRAVYQNRKRAAPTNDDNLATVS